MSLFKIRKYVHHRKEDMFTLVADIERYPEFLPMCEALVVRSRRGLHEKVVLIADMTIGYKRIHETFTTQIILQPQESFINVRYINGPFRYLENRWSFLSENNERGCFIDFFIEYEFKSRILESMMRAIFGTTFSRFADAFEKRADIIYGSVN